MSQRPFILAMDQGTTSSRAILFDHAGLPVHTIQREFPQIFPRPGWVEHDPRDIWTSQLSVATDVISRAGVAVGDVQAVGITNQRETTLVWDRRTGDPVYNAIVWQDRRTADFCDRLTREGFAGLITAKTGLVIDPYFSATKIRWILDSVAGARSDAEAGHLAFGTVDSWLLWKLTGGVVHATDFSNASRTMLLNIHTGQWDEELLNAMQVPRTMLPEVRPSSGEFGECITGIFGMPLPILAVAGDQQSALFGQACFDRGLAKNTYGTGCFMLMNIGDDPVPSHHKLLTTGAWNIDGKFTYALEGAVFAGGAVVQWLRDGLKLIDTAHQVEALALAVPDSGGVYLVPAFAGLGAPHWDPYARGTLIGLTRGTTAGHIARAALDAIAYQVADVLDTMRDDSGVEIKQLRADGGAAVNDLLMQTQADVLGVPVVRPKVIETTALGAAYLAGLACGYWRGINDIRSNWQVERVFEPSLAEDQRDANRSRWRKALKRSMNWEE